MNEPKSENQMPPDFVPTRDDYVRQELYIARLEAENKALVDGLIVIRSAVADLFTRLNQ